VAGLVFFVFYKNHIYINKEEVFLPDVDEVVETEIYIPDRSVVLSKKYNDHSQNFEFSYPDADLVVGLNNQNTFQADIVDKKTKTKLIRIEKNLPNTDFKMMQTLEDVSFEEYFGYVNKIKIDTNIGAPHIAYWFNSPKSDNFLLEVYKQSDDSDLSSVVESMIASFVFK
jgi:hypothetical protein